MELMLHRIAQTRLAQHIVMFCYFKISAQRSSELILICQHKRSNMLWISCGSQKAWM
ncbi:hypothetical protein GCM10023339_81610 [Alloalcanivorax gelatiniphagus]